MIHMNSIETITQTLRNVKEFAMRELKSDSSELKHFSGIGKVPVIAYLRENPDFGFEAQVSRIKHYCDAHDYESVDVYVDDSDTLTSLYALIGRVALDKSFSMIITCEEAHQLPADLEDRIGVALGIKSVMFRIIGPSSDRNAKTPRMVRHRNGTSTIKDMRSQVESAKAGTYPGMNETAVVYCIKPTFIERLSIDKQKSQMRSLCDFYGVKIHSIIEDCGDSDESNGMSSLMEAIGMVVVENIDFLLIWTSALLPVSTSEYSSINSMLVGNGHVIRTYLGKGQCSLHESELIDSTIIQIREILEKRLEDTDNLHDSWGGGSND